ncbi:MAG TPA: 30S ribosomal protein S5 [Candidatus Paceibacterota bacterium]|nr:30S ribosomal protein S5 [Candidatus Paceibacterota bacterium]HOL54020.1 30S ribosomal protein S5 [Candidatus Paceibacterota bacterium]HON21770.1 30S ribosomal protein S5 [Candidatus Paceibacterota bacterium]HPP17059.1 30S ribosomal protein S5 [Candidatus Paceibacterota bacterium]
MIQNNSSINKKKERVDELKEQGFEEKLLDLRRVTRVVAGGKRFSFRATLVIGDRAGRVGVGVAKGRDVSEAIAKAKAKAKKRVIEVPVVNDTIPHEVRSKYCAAEVVLKPAQRGHGIVAGGAVRTVCELAGIKDLSAKILSRTPNKLSNAMATLNALKKVKPTAVKQIKGSTLQNQNLENSSVQKSENEKRE